MPFSRKSMNDLNRPVVSSVNVKDKMPVTVILENIRSGLNIGSVFRTSDAFQVEKVILTGYSVVPPHREILKTALDATISVKWEYQDTALTAINQLKSNGYKIGVVEQVHGAVLLHDFNPLLYTPLALVFGNEVHGVSDEAIAMADFAVEIPQEGIKHSLNISVCAGVVLWHMYQSIILKQK
jgi:23S rRNA (guanosine2251-2'-O)-methyltransferase